MVSPSRKNGAVSWLAAAFVPVCAWAVYCLLVIPSILVIPMSFAGEEELVFPPRRFSLHLYERFFSSPVWTEALQQSFIVAIGSSLLATIIGVSAAYGLVRGSFPGRRLLTFFLFSPILMPAVVIALGIYLYFVQFRLSGTTFGIIIAHTVVTLPFVIVTTSAGIRQVDVNTELAAEMMGASRLTVLTRVVLPQILPSVFAGALFAFLISFDEVVLSWFIAGVGTATLPVVMFSSLKMEVSPVIAAAASLLISLSILFCLIGVFLTRKGPNE